MGNGIEREVLALKHAFHEALRKNPDRSHASCLMLGGRTVRIHSVGGNLAECLDRALALSSSPPVRRSEPELTIEAWSPAETGIAPPGSPAARADVRKWPTGIGTFMISANGRFIGSEAHKELFWLDRQSKCLTGYCAPEPEQSKFFKGRPLFFPLSVWHRDAGVQVIHAALVGRGGLGVLLPGRSGSGKTTVAVACALAGLDFLGDDHVGISRAGKGQWLGLGLYASAWLGSAQRSRFADLQRASISGRPPPVDKELVFVEQMGHGVFRRQVDIKAIALPRISGCGDSSYAPAGRMEAFHSLALGSMTSVIPRPGPDDLEALSELVRDIPVYRLDLGKCLDQIPRALTRLLDELSSS